MPMTRPYLVYVSTTLLHRRVSAKPAHARQPSAWRNDGYPPQPRYDLPNTYANGVVDPSSDQGYSHGFRALSQHRSLP